MEELMKAMVLLREKEPLQLMKIAIPEPGPDQVLLKVKACGVCRTDLHIVDGELKNPGLPRIPGHQIVGIVEKRGEKVKVFSKGDRVGVPWLGKTCGICRFCLEGKENLCENAQFTGYTIDGGFAEYAVAAEKFCFDIPKGYPDLQAAPLLCAGLIGYRALSFVRGAQSIGFYGFGAAAHILTQIAIYQKKMIYAFTRPGDKEGQKFALKLGAAWAEDSTVSPPQKLDAAIIFAPAGELVPIALKTIIPGGCVVCAGIHMSDIPSFSYDLLWGERSIKSVANLTRKDGEEFLKLAPRVPVKTKVNVYELSQANQALNDIRQGRISGAAVISLN